MRLQISDLTSLNNYSFTIASRHDLQMNLIKTYQFASNLLSKLRNRAFSDTVTLSVGCLRHEVDFRRSRCEEING